MARRKKAVVGDETEIFPEIDPGKPEDKKMYKAARKFAKEKADRDGLLTTCKEKVDSAHEALIAAMYEARCEKFRCDGLKVELFNRGEKAVVTVEGDEGETQTGLAGKVET
jgi:hypothetical protein